MIWMLGNCFLFQGHHIGRCGLSDFMLLGVPPIAKTIKRTSPKPTQPTPTRPDTTQADLT